MAKFAIVEFDNENTVGIVPVTWLSDEEDACYWPSLPGDKVARLVKQEQPFDPNWKLEKVHVLGKAGTLFNSTPSFYKDLMVT